MNTPEKQQLLVYYSSLHIASKDPKYREAMRIIAFAPGNFFKELADKLKIKLQDVVKLFKDFRIVKFFGKIGWSFKKLFEYLKKGYHAVKQLTKYIELFIEQQKVVKITSDTLKKFDAWLKDNPKYKRNFEILLGIALLFIYFFMADSGDPTYDFDLSDLLKALSGNIGFYDVFGGAAGVKLLTLFSAGFFTKITFPWTNVENFSFLIGIMTTLAMAAHQKLTKETNRDEFIMTSFLKKEKNIVKIVDLVIKNAKWIGKTSHHIYSMYTQKIFKTIVKNIATGEEFFYEFSKGKFDKLDENAKVTVWTKEKKNQFIIYRPKKFFRKFLKSEKSVIEAVPSDFEHFLGDVLWAKAYKDKKWIESKQINSQTEANKIFDDLKERFPESTIEVEIYQSADLQKTLN